MQLYLSLNLLSFLMGFHKLEYKSQLAFSPSVSLRIKGNDTCKQVIGCR